MPTTQPTRLITLDDAPALTDLVVRNREFMAPYDPVRGEDYYTLDGITHGIRMLIDEHGAGRALPQVIVDTNGEIAGRITINGIVRGPFQSGSIGYWVSEDRGGHGLASAAVAHIKQIAFGELGLHRLQAETLVDNLASQRVLAKNGFERYGLAPNYLQIAGKWQDHLMFQVLNPDME